MADEIQLSNPPLSLYIHIPWCVRKCPYCDFNSHAVKDELPVRQYIAALLQDLEADLPMVWGRPVHSVFIGGGTPSLFPADAIAEIISGVRARITISPAAEITMEANPGTLEHDSFAAYLDAGINRFSLGAQSFSDQQLKTLGRIHASDEILRAVSGLQAAGADNFNLDLMFGLPGQTPTQALADLQAAIDCEPQHISHYQLTMEPNTLFAHKPPAGLPDNDQLADIQESCAELLQAAGFVQYEVSAWAKASKGINYRSQHNLNYWRFGDYLGIGAGAHGKLTLAAEGRVLRTAKKKHPVTYMDRVADSSVDSGHIGELRQLSENDLVFEFFLNQLRLKDGVHKKDFSLCTGLAWARVEGQVNQAFAQGLLYDNGEFITTTTRGWHHLNTLQSIFL
ncbi:MAG: radical SAM family heme chaperone HemW [Xanthomonadales bacterium]|nr:radical SAM family heme chaperone HemW [Xanthomonadales bacterium]